MKCYKAPWSKTLIVMSLLATMLCIGIVFGTPLLPAPKHGGEVGSLMRWLLVPVAAACALFTARGYTITQDAILVHRLLWATRLSRAGLKSVSFEPGVMCRSVRTCGNGGFFSFTGYYWNKTLKSYRAFVTDPTKTVVLRYEQRTIVVSPDPPKEFVTELGSTLD